MSKRVNKPSRKIWRCQPVLLKWLGGERGTVSIYLSIILIAVLALTGVFVDYTRVKVAQNQAKRALDAATLSMLAAFDTKIKNDYGLFSIRLPYGEPEDFLRYVNSNLTLDYGNTLDLFEYRVESTGVEPLRPLADIDVLEMQILEYMKYRAPAALAMGVLDFFTNVQKSGAVTDSMKIKLEIDRKLGEIGKYQQMLSDNLNGDIGIYGVGKSYVKNFDNRNARGELIDELISDYKEYASLMRRQYEASKEGSGGDAGEQDDDDNTRIGELRDSMSKNWTELYNSQTKDFLESNKKAVEYIKKISSISLDITELVDKLEISVEEGKNAGGVDGLINNALPGENGTGGALDTGTFDSVTDNMEGNIEKYRESLIGAEKAVAYIDKLESNISCVSQTLADMDSIKSDLLNYGGDGDTLAKSQIMSSLKGVSGSYKYDIDYNYDKVNKEGSYTDPRKGVGDEVNEILGIDKDENGSEETKKISDLGIDLKDLPSKNPYKDGENTQGGGVADTGQVEYTGLGNKENYESNESTFAEKAMDAFKGAIGVLKDGVKGAINNLYVNEYVVSMFKNGSQDKYALNGDKAGLRRSFFNAEVEYIIGGDESESTNMLYTKTRIFIVRFVMNFLHVYTDADKLAMSQKIAVAVSSWWSAGLAVPVVSNLINAAWSASESVLDMDSLIKGEKVAFFKLPGDWISNVGVGKADAAKTDEKFKVTYIFYLRLFLLIVNREDKLSRINDLLEVNMFNSGDSFKVRESYCAVYTELEASIKYLFLTKTFMPKTAMTGDGRHRVSANIVRGLF
jgi:hypothetical protein